MTAMMSIVLVTPALLALNRCSLRFAAPPTIDMPGMRRTPARMLPTIDPSTSSPLACVSAMLYSTISMTLPNEALMTAPTPIELCAEMDATAMPMKYESGMTERRAETKTNAWLEIKRKTPPPPVG